MAAPYALTMLNTEQRRARKLSSSAAPGRHSADWLRFSLLTSHFIDKLAAFHQRHPQIHLRIVDRIDSELYKLLLMHDIDIALGPLPHDEKIVVRGKINWQDRICIVASSTTRCIRRRTSPRRRCWTIRGSCRRRLVRQ